MAVKPLSRSGLSQKQARNASLAEEGRGAVSSGANGGVLLPVGWAGKPDPHAGRTWSGMIRTPRAHAAGAVALRPRPAPAEAASQAGGGWRLAGGAPGPRQS